MRQQTKKLIIASRKDSSDNDRPSMFKVAGYADTENIWEKLGNLKQPYMIQDVKATLPCQHSQLLI